jgi:diguanylate cyclase (GGDEF)-like protein
MGVLGIYMERDKMLQQFLTSIVFSDEPEAVTDILTIIENPFFNKKGIDVPSLLFHRFYNNTEVPIALPLFSFYSILSAWCVMNKTTYRVPLAGDRPYELDTWVMALAPSGSAKTLSIGEVLKMIPMNPETAEPIIEPNFSKDGKIVGYSAIRYDITDKKLIEILSITDGLTNIYNRRYFNEIFPKIINNAKRKNELISFLFMDIDHFKQYNDNYGHQKGDEVLIKFAKCLKESLNRSSDFAFRLGGEEFAIVYQTDTKEKAIEFANIIKINIEDLEIIHEFNSASPYITASMGLICKNANDIDDKIYKQADDLLYEAKRSGRNQIKVNE